MGKKPSIYKKSFKNQKNNNHCISSSFDFKTFNMEPIISNIDKDLYKLQKRFPSGVGEDIVMLLKQLTSRKTHVKYLRMLIAESGRYLHREEERSQFHKVLSEDPDEKVLTDRELDIVLLLSDRYTNQEIADKLFISVVTVKKHISNIMAKLGAKDRREAVNKALDLGLLTHKQS